ncbi:ArsO family NAD(P)H-dependent flavin-containing monooxygenase [Streptomyces sp. NPDC005931]|uniref:ArsO family NAD(P)H-dependent flavin-containing monooxygenase n=1 Tax=Streptomyces sp. NPDC005931 TaxID=3364737 RepID=UPI003675F051
MTQRTNVVVIGGGQAGLAAGYHLRRLGIEFVVLDAQPAPGGAWQHAWDSLRLFSPAAYSSLPGRLMPAQEGQTCPDAAHVVAYLADYEKRHELPAQHGVFVDTVHDDGMVLRVETDSGTWRARTVVSATGTWTRPFVPAVEGRREFPGRQLHTVQYKDPSEFAGQRVVGVGGGNPGAQIAADLTGHAQVTWPTQRPPRYLHDDIDGRALDEGRADPGGVASLGDIVAVPPVRAARDTGLLAARPMFTRLTATGVEWADGSRQDADAVTWCTGFRPALAHLAGLRLRGVRGHIATVGTRAADDPRLHFLGYDDWTGLAATLIGVGRTAREAAREIRDLLA